MNILVWLIYIVSCLVMLACWFCLLRNLKHALLRDLLFAQPLSLCFTPTLVDQIHVAPAVAGLALDLVAEGVAGFTPHGLILLLSMLITSGVVFVLSKYLRPELTSS